MILIWSAPWRICSRTARRTSSAPSASDMVKAMALQQRHGGGAPSVRRRESLWPPVGPMARPEMNRRGPGRSPPSTAALMPQSAPPVSRTVVKPRSIMPRISGAARAVMSVSGMFSRFRMFTSLRYTCTWQSISPGMSVRPPPSITVAPARHDRPVGDLADQLVLDEHLAAAQQSVLGGVEQLHVAEEILGHRPHLLS